MNRREFAGLLALGRTCAAGAKLRIRSADRVIELDVERYTAGVLMGEASTFRSTEGLKAMAVVARTYGNHFRARHANQGFDLCDTTHCQRFDAAGPSLRILNLTRETAGQVVLIANQPAAAYYTLDCGGQTEDARNVWPDQPQQYLTAHADSNCQSPRWHWSTTAPGLAAALSKAELRAPSDLTQIEIIKRTASGRASELFLVGRSSSVRISASALRFAIGRHFGFNTVQSDLYQVGISGRQIIFDGKGSGHGVGLCQRGADRMGEAGHSYREILAFYFPGASIPSALTWHRVTGERIVLWSTQPDHDKTALPSTEQLLDEAERRTSLRAPQVELRIYPSVAEFIAATGEPGWVAARVSANQIDLQPIATLRSRGALETTLRHELFHILIEHHARPGLPVWFREGLAEYLAGEQRSSAAGNVNDGDLRQTADQARARAAYEAAIHRVAALVVGYGETSVVGWLKLGLPREEMKASAIAPPTKSK